MEPKSTFHYLRLFLVPLLIIVLGMVGYMLLEGWSWFDAFYMAVITLSTVGFGEVGSLGRGGRLFTAFLILTGIGAFAVVFTSLTEAIVEGHISGALKKNRLQRRLRTMQDHYIVCGYGRVGTTLVERLHSQGRSILVVDQNPAKEARLPDDGIGFLAADAVQEETLRRAGAARAAGLSFCLASDADNLFGVLSARTLYPDIHIAARVQDVSAESKMRFAGANAVINPTSIAGYSMAMHLVQPGALKVFEFLTMMNAQGYMLETVKIGHCPDLVHKSVGALRFRDETGLSLLQILRQDQALVSDVQSDTVFLPNDTLLVLGPRDAVTDFCARL